MCACQIIICLPWGQACTAAEMLNHIDEQAACAFTVPREPLRFWLAVSLTRELSGRACELAALVSYLIFPHTSQPCTRVYGPHML